MEPELPPGTIKDTFWTRSATRTAIGTTVLVALGFAHRFIAAKVGEEVAVAFDVVVGQWLIAAGINTVGAESFKRIK